MSKREKLVQAAIDRLARGDGKGGLLDLGVQRSEAIRDAGVGGGLIDNHFRTAGQGNSVRGLVNEVIETLEREQLRLRDEAAADYDDRAEFIADGAGRRMIEKSLLGELEHYGAVSGRDAMARARERLYYLAVALCDATTTGSGAPILPTDKVVPDNRFRRHLLRLHKQQQPALTEVYAAYLRAANREPVHDAARIERVVSAFLEGALVQRRIVAGHAQMERSALDPSGEQIALGDDALIDAVLRIFIAMSRPAGTPAIDPDAVLFGEESSEPQVVDGESILHRDRAGLYAAILGAIDRLPAESTISHCALHSSGVPPRLTEEGDGLHAAIDRFTERGGELFNIEKISSVEELDTTIEWLEERVADRRRIHFKALVIDAPPGLSPLLLGDELAFLGREQDGVIIDAASFTGDAGRQWCQDHFKVLWEDARSYLLASPNALNRRGIENARMQLAEL